jgi:hypothetical protein
LCIISVEMMTDTGRVKDGTEWGSVEGKQEWTEN